MGRGRGGTSVCACSLLVCCPLPIRIAIACSIQSTYYIGYPVNTIACYLTDIVIAPIAYLIPPIAPPARIAPITRVIALRVVTVFGGLHPNTTWSTADLDQC